MVSADPNAEAAFAKAAADFPTDPLIKFHYQRLNNGESGNADCDVRKIGCNRLRP